MAAPNAFLPMPEFHVDADGTARSVQFDDVYFSRHGGVAETEHVFLAGNGLPERWMERDSFTIGELGFGTGLNFLTSWRAFEASGAPGRLHFLSLEKYPLTHAQLTQALAHQPGLAEYSAQLVAMYPLRLPGLHRMDFGRVSLTLGLGDAADLLPQTQAQVDAWFLDGFAPAKNPDMWDDTICAELARLSAPHATLASFTVAGAVRRGLEANGFTLQKIKGFGHKREMLSGRYAPAGGVAPSPISAHQAGVVIGAGIAGCTIARALAERGMRVTVLERGEVASGASGNRAAVLYPQLTKHYLPATQWHFSGYAQMLRDLVRWKAAGLIFGHAEPGMLKIAKDAEDEQRLHAIRSALQLDASIARFVTRAEASELLGMEVARDGFYFPRGSWISPAELCHVLLTHPNITVHTKTEVTAMTQGNVETTRGRFHADQIVIATAQDAAKHGLKLGVSAGQVSLLSQTPKPACILCQKGYAITVPEGLLIGATYDRQDMSGAVTHANHQHNIAELQNALPKQALHPSVIEGRTSFRATTPDRLPYVGALAEGIWVSAGHGSRGMISAPLAASLIAADIFGEPLPVSRDLRAAVDPHR